MNQTVTEVFVEDPLASPGSANDLGLKWKKIKIPPFIVFKYLKKLYGNGDTIRIRREIQCLPYVEFFTESAHWANLV